LKPAFSVAMADRMPPPISRPTSHAAGPATSTLSRFRVREPPSRAVSSWRAVMVSPEGRVCQQKRCGASSSITVQTRAGWPGCLIRTRLPTTSTPWSNRSTADMVGVISGNASTSRVSRQTSVTGASISVMLSNSMA